jgi:predicted nucleic acid-binding protein
MIVLDTNVVSEALKPEPNAAVLAWLNAQAAETVYLSSVTVAELLFGVGVLPDSARKDRLNTRIARLIDQFGGRILPFDTPAARRYAELAARARSAGKGFPTPDGYIAAIAASKGFAVASRDISAFSAGGLAVIDPWAAGA